MFNLKIKEPDYKQLYESRQAKIDSLNKTISGLKGRVTMLENKKNKLTKQTNKNKMMNAKVKFYHATNEERERGEDVKEFDFKTPNLIVDFLEEQYLGKMKKVVFIVMVNDLAEYYISDSYFNVCSYLETKAKTTLLRKVFVFEEPTFEEAFGYCKDHCEIHELGLNP